MFKKNWLFVRDYETLSESRQKIKIKKLSHTLHFDNNEPSKNKHFLILLSSLARYSQEPRLKRIFEILNWKIAKMALLNPCMEFKIYFGQTTSFQALWRWHLQKISLTYPKFLDLGQSEYKTEIFSKRTHKISKIIFKLGSCEYLELARLESKIRKCLFFDGSLL